MTRPRFEAAGGYVIDWKWERLCSFGDPESSAEAAARWNANDAEDDPDEYDWAFGAGDASSSLAKPADCPDHYWAAPYQCLDVRNSLLRKAEQTDDWDFAFAADWGQMFQYCWRLMFKKQPVDDLRKIEHYARILRERIEGVRK